jgi:hypothetical protein
VVRLLVSPLYKTNIFMKGKIVTYYPNGQDYAMPEESYTAIVVATGKRSLPTEKSAKGEVITSKEVETVSLVIFTDAQDGINCTVPRKDVVAKDKSKTDLYELPYYE